MSRLFIYDVEEPVVQAIDLIELSSSITMEEIHEAQQDDEMV